MEEMKAPGTWCTDWAFFREVAASGARRFLEIGCGEGRVSEALCEFGLTGVGVEPAPEAAARCRIRLAPHLAARRFSLYNGTAQELSLEEPVDLVFSQMVLEHVDDDLALVQEMTRHLAPGGTLIAVVPARPECWGAEDDLSGHLRRYSRNSLSRLFIGAGLSDITVKSLNVPVSNMLQRYSEQAVSRGIGQRLELGVGEQTELSGLRDIPFKNQFPEWCRLVLNPVVMWPLCQIQRAFFASDQGLVLMATGTTTLAAAQVSV